MLSVRRPASPATLRLPLTSPLGDVRRSVGQLPSRSRAPIVARCVDPSGEGDKETSKPSSMGRRGLALNSVAVLGVMYGYAPPKEYSAGGRGSGGAALSLPGFDSESNDAMDALKYYDNLDSDFVFAYPNNWILRPNGQRAGLIISNYRTSDRANLEILPANTLPSYPDLDPQELVDKAAELIVAPEFSTKGDSRQFLPRKVAFEKKTVADVDYYDIEFFSTTITESGYDVRKHNVGCVAALNDQIYIFNASIRTDTFDKLEEPVRQMVSSFRVRNIGTNRVRTINQKGDDYAPAGTRSRTCPRSLPSAC